LIPLDTEERLVYARRLVAQRCLYGVDKNPLAVEMAKLSLWLLTLAKDKPFTFLDHCVRSGDSLVGISSIEQLLRFSLDERVSTGPLLEQQRKQIENRLNAVKMLRKQIEEQPSNTPEDIERKSLMLKNADEQTRRLTYAADMLLAESWQPMSAAERESALNSALVQVEYKFKDLPVEELDADAKKRLHKAGVDGRFHWPLEFPEVFQNGGLEAFVCNPPFMGGQKITGALGEAFREFLVARLAAGRRGSADLCSYFFLRARQLLREGGQLGFLATNTIAQGDTREVGLEQLTADGCVIPRAVASCPWPGAANLEVAQVWVRRGAWRGPFVLDDKPASGITAFLSAPGTITGNPHRLKANEGKSFQGSIVLGMGFVLEPEEARRLIDKDPRNKDVLFPYLNGEDLNSRPDQSPSRWVINFFDWSMEKAKSARDCFHIVEEKVKSERLANKYSKTARERWWLYERWRPELYQSISGMQRALAISLVSKHMIAAWEPVAFVFSHALGVIASDEDRLFALVQSTPHEEWARHCGSTLETRMRYTPSDCFETFPFPSRFSTLGWIGSRYDERRHRVTDERQEGLTKTYNRFHDPDEASADIQELRQLHVEMDHAVAAAYGWTDLDLGHGFHETKQGIRFTIRELARREVLQRLLKLNHERYAEEVKQGLHEKKKPKATKGRKKTAANPATAPLFDAAADVEPSDQETADANGDVWYFAYGSNLWIDQKQDRTGAIRQGSERPRIATLADHRLAFNKQGAGGEVFANIIAAAHETVVGVIYRCNPDAMLKMVVKEGGYERRAVRVVTDDGEAVEAITYIAPPSSTTDERPPTSGYLTKIITGARQHGLPEEYIQQIELWATRGA